MGRFFEKNNRRMDFSILFFIVVIVMLPRLQPRR